MVLAVRMLPSIAALVGNPQPVARGHTGRSDPTKPRPAGRGGGAHGGERQAHGVPRQGEREKSPAAGVVQEPACQHVREAERGPWRGLRVKMNSSRPASVNNAEWKHPIMTGERKTAGEENLTPVPRPLVKCTHHERAYENTLLSNLAIF